MKFKGYKYLILSMAAAFSLTSCLDEDPLYSQNNEIVFSNPENANLALRGCYSYFATGNVYGQNMQEVLIAVGGHAWAQRNASDQDLFVSLSPTPSIGQVGTMWDGLYKVISESNAFIENMQGSGLSEELITQYVGEAKFLRAVAYLNLVTLFGDVPLKTVASTSEGIAMPRTPREDVFKQIIQDLTDALAISEEPEENERALIEEEYYRQIYLAIDTLSEQRRQVIRKSLAGKTVKEIAAEMSISENTVKTLKKNAYEDIRSQISKVEYAFFLFLMHNL